jgi:cytochrome P450
MGAPLARMEAKIALETLLPRIPEYTISGPVKWIDKVHIRGLEKLPVTF